MGEWHTITLLLEVFTQINSVGDFIPLNPNFNQNKNKNRFLSHPNRTMTPKNPTSIAASSSDKITPTTNSNKLKHGHLNVPHTSKSKYGPCSFAVSGPFI